MKPGDIYIEQRALDLVQFNGMKPTEAIATARKEWVEREDMRAMIRTQMEEANG